MRTAKKRIVSRLISIFVAYLVFIVLIDRYFPAYIATKFMIELSEIKQYFISAATFTTLLRFLLIIYGKDPLSNRLPKSSVRNEEDNCATGPIKNDL